MIGIVKWSQNMCSDLCQHIAEYMPTADWCALSMNTEQDVVKAR